MQMSLFEWKRDLSLTIVDSGYACGDCVTGKYRGKCCDRLIKRNLATG